MLKRKVLAQMNLKRSRLAALMILLIGVLLSGCGKKTEGELQTETAAQTAETTKEETAVTETEESVQEEASESETKEHAKEETTEDETEETAEEKSFRADNSFIDEFDHFTVTSEDIHDGVWDDVISNTNAGSNKSPQLSWEPVEGAETYLIYMSDLGAWNLIHWKSSDITETDLPEGWAPGSDYIGPYPPSGATHTYEIYVIALKKPIERMKGGLGGQNPRFEENFKAADTDIDGNTGNIVAVGVLSGTFTGK